MNKLFIFTLLFVGLSMHVSAQKHPPLPPHPSKTELVDAKMRELDKRYNTEKKLILNHPLATKQMKRDQLKALNKKYQSQKRLLRSMK
ncbi:hypothetical protein MP478_01345 [Chryseobacterium sp. WG14]|uniref:hypothetical protein n=1 Tax=unclassified Chryseobacterium TaxID=2593645 RepID=UPI001DF6877A|nr:MULTISPECIES: hypothetical protein [unclassified Chryseobacterium]MCQ9634315.1 hypothetical protein [Chryseobacterium sp. WG23]MCQ9638017.1 hypothetical protein [Chryseobacterium sp. WG14]CAH0188768.1 hypothetical protein SRABI04_01685 [Chryseobacterium sp. Bi04]